jgi:hypothetical protein
MAVMPSGVHASLEPSHGESLTAGTSFGSRAERGRQTVSEPCCQDLSTGRNEPHSPGGYPNQTAIELRSANDLVPEQAMQNVSAEYNPRAVTSEARSGTYECGAATKG